MPITRWLGLLGIAVAVHAAPEMRTVETEHYILHTAQGPADVREAVLRTDVLYDTFRSYFGEFDDRASTKQPIYIFTTHAAYSEATGVRESSGLYNGAALYVSSEHRAGERTWRTVQHEAFHQFAHRVIRARMPVWVNEGLAEYFERGLFTGDAYVFGVVTEEERREVARRINARQFKPLSELMSLTNAEWWDDLSVNYRAGRNYQQAWSVVYFLLHYDRGRYAQAFRDVLSKVGRGVAWDSAWNAHFSDRSGVLDREYAAFWEQMPRNPAQAKEIEALTRTFLNFAARSVLAGETPRSMGRLLRAARRGDLEQPDELWLPPSLAMEAAQEANRLGDWELDIDGDRGTIRARTRDGVSAVGEFRLQNGAIAEVSVETTEGRRRR